MILFGSDGLGWDGVVLEEYQAENEMNSANNSWDESAFSSQSLIPNGTEKLLRLLLVQTMFSKFASPKRKSDRKLVLK